MKDFVTTDRDLFYRLGEARLAAMAAALTALDENSAPDVMGALERMCDLSMGLDELRGMPAGDDDDWALVNVGYLLEAYALNAVAPVPFLPRNTNVAGSGIGWQDVVGLDGHIRDVVNGMNLSPGEYVYPANTPPVAVSLNSGQLGKYPNGSLVYVANKTMLAVLRDIAAEVVYPTYAPAQLVLATSTPLDGETGEAVAVQLTATFVQNDAGAYTRLVVERGGVPVAGAGANPHSASESVVRGQPLTYRAQADYGAGPKKAVAPANTPDTRTPQVRSNNAPQASEAGFESAAVSFTGHELAFFGPTANAPAASGAVRALPGRQLTSAGNQFVLNTGTAYRFFAIVLPFGRTLVNVTDLDNQQANITASYQPQGTLSVADAGGTVTDRPLYLLVANAPYLASARHLVTYA